MWGTRHPVLGMLVAGGREEAEGKEHGGDEEGEGSEDPHEDGTEDLIVEDGDEEGIGVVDVEAVDGTVAEGKEGGEKGHDDVGEGEVDDGSPVVGARVGGPGAKDGPPKKDGGEEEAEVLRAMDGFVLQREVVGGGDVPAEVGEIHGEPRDGRRDEPVCDAAKSGCAQEWTDEEAYEECGKAA